MTIRSTAARARRRMHLDSDLSLPTVLLTLTGVVMLLSFISAVELGRDALLPIGGVTAVVIGVLWLGGAFLMRHSRIADALQTASGIAAVCLFVAVFVFAEQPSAVVRRGLLAPIDIVVTALGVLAESAQTFVGLLVLIGVILLCILRQRSPG